MNPLLLRPEEAAEVLGVSRSRLYELLASGEIASVRIGTSRRVTAAELERYVETLVAAQLAAMEDVDDGAAAVPSRRPAPARPMPPRPEPRPESRPARTGAA